MSSGHLVRASRPIGAGARHRGVSASLLYRVQVFRSLLSITAYTGLLYRRMRWYGLGHLAVPRRPSPWLCLMRCVRLAPWLLGIVSPGLLGLGSALRRPPSAPPFFSRSALGLLRRYRRRRCAHKWRAAARRHRKSLPSARGSPAGGRTGACCCTAVAEHQGGPSRTQALNDVVDPSAPRIFRHHRVHCITNQSFALNQRLP